MAITGPIRIVTAPANFDGKRKKVAVSIPTDRGTVQQTFDVPIGTAASMRLSIARQAVAWDLQQTQSPDESAQLTVGSTIDAAIATPAPDPKAQAEAAYQQALRDLKALVELQGMGASVTAPELAAARQAVNTARAAR